MYLIHKNWKEQKHCQSSTRFLRQSQILKTTGELHNLDSTIALRQAITGHKELLLAMIQPHMQADWLHFVNYMIQAQDTLVLLKS